MPTTDELVQMTGSELDDLFRSLPAGPLPTGPGAGTALLGSAIRGRRAAAAFVRRTAWQGKDLAPDGRSLRNRISPFGLRAVAARVYEGPSRVDGDPCVVLDYSRTSWLARWVRDEMREVAPGTYLGIVFLRSRQLPLRFVLEFAPASLSEAAEVAEAAEDHAPEAATDAADERRRRSPDAVTAEAATAATSGTTSAVR
jgi:hypothetical protein